MVITINGELEAALHAAAATKGIAAEELALTAIRERFVRQIPLVPRDEWERELFAMAIDCGVSLPNSAFTSEEMYD
jgi:hypothetical protein